MGSSQQLARVPDVHVPPWDVNVGEDSEIGTQVSPNEGQTWGTSHQAGADTF